MPLESNGLDSSRTAWTVEHARLCPQLTVHSALVRNPPAPTVVTFVFSKLKLCE